MTNECIAAQANIPVVLTIAGSDNSGGAGIEADLKTFTTLGVYGTAAVTCVVAEHPGRVSSIEAVSLRSVEEQIRLVFEAFPVQAMKTGMLYSQEIIETVVLVLEQHGATAKLVIDPVMVATSGTQLLHNTAITTLKNRLIPKAALVTPNRDEAEILAGEPIQNFADLRRVALRLAEEFAVPFLVKGGHLGGPEALDVLAVDGILHEYSAPMVPNLRLHGTGCTFSAAITSQLALGQTLVEAVRRAKRFITQAIARRVRIGPYDLLNHLPVDPLNLE